MKYEINQWVWSTRLHMAMEITEFYEASILFSCSLHAANYYSTIYVRYANGLEVFETLARRERVEAKFKELLNRFK